MLNPLPTPPQGSEQWLHQLVSYYRQLVDYHQQAAQNAARQLAHLEVLLSNNDRTSTVAVSGAIHDINHPSEQVKEVQVLPSFPRELIDRIAALLTLEKGHALHLDYIVRTLYGQLEPETLKLTTDWVKQALGEGEAVGKWSSIPDSPQCWTLDLDELNQIPENNPSLETTLTTREVAELIQTHRKTISKIKSLHAEKFQEGIHYLVDSRNGYHWRKSGVELLQNILSPNKQRSRLSGTSQKLKPISEDPPRLPPYNEINLMESIRRFLEKEKGNIFSIKEISRALYGNLAPSELSQVSLRVGKHLSMGKGRGYWASVPEQKGYYTWRLNLRSEEE